jgi:tRNA U34 5-carboxymethylaminomethyl modifying GTPase MnmE/TrmE
MGCACSGAVAPAALIPITILGLPDVGKTSIVEILASDCSASDPPVPTCGVLQHQINVHDHSFLFYDVCGYLSHQDE